MIVVGGGNTAMDAVRTARRLGAQTATLVYRRSEAEMPARAEEVKHAREEGIEFRMLTNPSSSSATKRAGSPARVACAWNWASPTPAAAAALFPLQARNLILPANVAIIGVGTTANPLIQSIAPDLATNKRNYIVADPETMRTTKRGVFAGGDIVTGGATVILAMGAGRKAAEGIDEYLKTGEWDEGNA